MSNRTSFGGMNTGPVATRGNYAPRDLLPLPAQSILAASAPLELSEIAESLIDESELGACLFFLSVLVVSAVVLLLVYCGFQSFVPQSVEY